MSDKQSVVLQTCLHVLGSKLGGFFSELSCLQLSSALSVLTMAPRTNEVLAAHSKVWEEMIHPFKLLVECEKAFYEWTFMTPIPAYDLSATPNAGGAPTEKRAKGSGNEDHVKYMYSQIPMALRKTMTHLQKMMGPAFAGTSSKLPTSASSVHHLAAYATSAAVGGADAAHFASLYHLLDELISGYVMLKITMIQLYQNLNAPYVTAARVKDMNWSELARVCANLSAKCDKAFTHASLMRVKDALLRPELFLLEQLCMLEGEQAMMPACDAKHTMFLLMRVRLEHTRWMQRLLARDRERSTSPTSGTGQSLGSASRKLGGMPGGIGSPAGPLVVQTVSCTFPAVLHWTHLLHHSLLCKATLLFWNTLHSAEIRGDEMQQKLERLDANYVGMSDARQQADTRAHRLLGTSLSCALTSLVVLVPPSPLLSISFASCPLRIDKLVKRLPNCYSFSVLLDCSGLPRVVDPAHPLVLHDVLAPPPTDDAPPGGLARYPVVFTWPLSRPPLEKWNLVSTLIAKQDLMAGLAGTPGPLTIPRQTATYTLAVGPSNQTSDLMIWSDKRKACPHAALDLFGLGTHDSLSLLLSLRLFTHSSHSPSASGTTRTK